MIDIKNKSAILKMREAGKRLCEIVSSLDDILEEGISTFHIDHLIEQSMLKAGLKPECKGYAGYRFATCISPNDVVVHGVPSKKVILKSGDFVKIDVVGSFKGYCADMARPFFIGKPSQEVLDLANAAIESFGVAVGKAVPGGRLSDISSAVQVEVERRGFSVVREFAGHGIGRKLHESPEIPNFGKAGEGPILREGMTLAIEPMVTQKSCSVVIESDGWTARTSDGCLASHFENTILVTSNGPELLTSL